MPIETGRLSYHHDTTYTPRSYYTTPLSVSFAARVNAPHLNPTSSNPCRPLKSSRFGRPWLVSRYGFGCPFGNLSTVCSTPAYRSSFLDQYTRADWVSHSLVLPHLNATLSPSMPLYSCSTCPDVRWYSTQTSKSNECHAEGGPTCLSPSFLVRRMKLITLVPEQLVTPRFDRTLSFA